MAQNGTDYSAADLQEKMNLAPDIEGTEKVIQEINGLKRVTYERDGEYIGEYKKEVTQTDENGEVTEVGGIVLIGFEAEKILNEQLAKTGSDYLIALPADISDLTTLENVNLDLNMEPFFNEPYTIRISFNGEKISVCNVMLGETKIRQATYPANDYIRNISEYSDINSSSITEGKEMEYISVLSKFVGDNKYQADFQKLKFGDFLGETNDSILVGMYSSEGPVIQSFENILMIDEVPVFVSSK